MKPIEKIKNLIGLNIELKYVLILLFFIGVILLLVSSLLKTYKLPFEGITHELGVLFVTITPTLFIYELALRRLFIEEMKSEMKKILNGEFKKDFWNIIKQTLPSSFENILQNGITDTLIEIDSTDLKNRFINANNTEVKMIKIFIPYLFDPIEPHVFVEAVRNRNCNFKIVLFDPNCNEAINRRIRTIDFTHDDYCQEIKKTLKFLQTVWRQLEKAGTDSNGVKYIDKLEVKLHDDFISGSLIGLQDYFIFGVYLHQRVATRGMQFIIEKGVNSDSKFFKELTNHFEVQWQIAYKNVKFFTDKEYEIA